VSPWSKFFIYRRRTADRWHTTRENERTRVPSGRRAASAGQRQRRALPIRLMLGAAKVYFIIFGILTIAGGIVGYVKAGSVISVIAGSISGILLLVAAWLMPDRQAAGLIIALVVSVLLAGQFVPKFFSTHKVMPAGLMSVLSVLGIVVALAAWLRK
jgi:uncharacterized membrane protein (UPF0136 family)